jgi:hypothetical protein
MMVPRLAGFRSLPFRRIQPSANVVYSEIVRKCTWKVNVRQLDSVWRASFSTLWFILS